MSPRLLRASLYVAFVLSGLAGLVYEILWSKYLTLFIGGTAVAHTIVLTTFMGGLALGNALFGRLADVRGRNRLLMYAVLELGVGLFCLLFPRLFAALGSFYVNVATRTGPTSPFNPVLKALLATGAMLVPCALMGGTLPVLAKYVVDSVSAAGVRLSLLYFLNTVGAVAGCIAGGFYVVEHWGLEFGMIGTALVNCSIAGVFYVLSRRERRALRRAESGSVADAVAEDELDASARDSTTRYSHRQARIALWSMAVAGGLTMMYELVWFRLLVLAIGGTVHSFSTMLMGFIAGLAAGSLLAGRLLRTGRNALALLGVCELAIAVLTLVPFRWFEALPFAFFQIGSRLNHTPENYGVYLACAVVFAVALMGAPAMFMGAALPLASRVCVDRLDALGRTVGDVFSVNTIGNAAGALLTGLIVLPRLGLEGTLLTGACSSGALGVVILHAWRSSGPVAVVPALRDGVRAEAPERGRRLWPAALALLAALGTLRVAAYPQWDPRLLQAGLYRWERHSPLISWREFRRQRAGIRVVYHRDGADASLLVEEPADASRPGLDRIVRVNGKPDASSGGDLTTQLFVGHLGMLFHPNPRRAMVVGLGSGATVGAVLRYPGVTVDVAEISPEMVDAAAYFDGVNDRVLANPRLSLSVLDAREYLLLTRNRYDVIVSEPTNVYIPGVAMLFTEDFYGLVQSRLAPEGLFVQWLHAYAIDEAVVASTVASLTRVFPYVSLWAVGESDLVFLASRSRPRFDPEQFRRRFFQVQPTHGIDSVHPWLSSLGHPGLFLLNQVASDQAVRMHWLRASGRPYRDLFPRMEFSAARAQFVGAGFLLTAELDERFRPYSAEPLFVQEYIRGNPSEIAELQRLRPLPPMVPYRQVSDAFVVKSVLAGEAGPEELTSVDADLAGGVLLARELGLALDRSGRSTASMCSAYLDVQGRALAAASSVLGRPSTDVLEARIDACVKAVPERADEFSARLIVVLAASGASEHALYRFERAVTDRIVDRLHPRDAASLLVQGARLFLCSGRTADALQCVQAALARQPEHLEARKLLVALTSTPNASRVAAAPTKSIVAALPHPGRP